MFGKESLLIIEVDVFIVSRTITLKL